MLIDHHHSHHQSSHYHDEDVHAALTVSDGSAAVVTNLTVDDDVTDGVQMGGATVVMSRLARIGRGEDAFMVLEGANLASCVRVCISRHKDPRC